MTAGRDTRQEVFAIIHMSNYVVFHQDSSCGNGEVDLLRSVYERMPLRAEWWGEYRVTPRSLI